MANDIKGKDVAQTAPLSQTKNPVKYVRNRSGHRVELLIENKVVVFMPGSNTAVPTNFEVPNGLGLYVR